MGNLLSVTRALEHCGADVERVSNADGIARADRLVLPGVGAFAGGMRELAARGLVEPLRSFAASGQPLLGICLGMQMLMEQSTEFGVHEGLGIVPGTIEEIPKVDTVGRPQKVPHIGWSPLTRANGTGWDGSVLEGFDEGESFYFVHSFAAAPGDAVNRLADTSYGGHVIAAVIRRGAIVGTQFHPEKSGPAGLALVDNFVRL
jgi:glutamine amidotransferase